MPFRVSRYAASLSGLLVAVAALAVALSWGRRLLPVPGRPLPPLIGDHVLYENAEPSYDLSVPVGPNTFSVKAVVRNDRDGSTLVEDGRGKALNNSGFPVNPALAGRAGWLDMADVLINPDATRFDVIDLRVFDHKTRRLLSNQPGMGASHEPSRPPVVHLFGLGHRLPASVDVWFRASSHSPGESIARLEARAGASTPLAGGSLSIREIHQGTPAYTVVHSPTETRNEYQWLSTPGDNELACTVVLDWAGQPVDSQYEIYAVGRDGRKVFPDIPHILVFRARAMPEAIRFDIAPADLSRLEVRPFGGRHTFYLDDVKLPVTSKRPFRAPPSARVAVDGKEVARSLSEFDPILVTLRVWQGKAWNGISSRGFTTPTPPGVDRQDRSAFTVGLEVVGLSGAVWDLSYFDREGKPLDPRTGGRTSQMKSGGDRKHFECSTFEVALEKVGEVEVQAVPKP